jgi:hypothetical protein
MSINQTHGNKTILMNNDNAYWYAKYMKYKGKYLELADKIGGANYDMGVDFIITIKSQRGQRSQRGAYLNRIGKLPGFILAGTPLEKSNLRVLLSSFNKDSLKLLQQKQIPGGRPTEIDRFIQSFFEYILSVNIVASNVPIFKKTENGSLEENTTTIIHIVLQNGMTLNRPTKKGNEKLTFQPNKGALNKDDYSMVQNQTFLDIITRWFE